MKITEQTMQYAATSAGRPGRGESRTTGAPDPGTQRVAEPEVICEIYTSAEHAEQTAGNLRHEIRAEGGPLQKRTDNAAEQIGTGFVHEDSISDPQHINAIEEQPGSAALGTDTALRNIAVLIGQRANAAASGALAAAASEARVGPITDAVRAALSDPAGAIAKSMPLYGQDMGGGIAESIRRSLEDIMERAGALADRSAAAGAPQLAQEAPAKDNGAAGATEGGGENSIQRALKAAASLHMSLVEQYANRPQNERLMSAETAQMRPDAAASSILRKARLGGRIEPSDLSYVSRTRPDQLGLLSRTTAERDALTRRMRNARSKSEVRMVHLGAVVTAGKTSISSGEADTRLNQLNEAKYEYVKTAEYRKKPELPPRSLRRRPGEGQGYLRNSPKTCGKAMRNAINTGRTF